MCLDTKYPIEPFPHYHSRSSQFNSVPTTLQSFLLESPECNPQFSETPILQRSVINRSSFFHQSLQEPQRKTLILDNDVLVQKQPKKNSNQDLSLSCRGLGNKPHVRIKGLGVQDAAFTV